MNGSFVVLVPRKNHIAERMHSMFLYAVIESMISGEIEKGKEQAKHFRKNSRCVSLPLLFLQQIAPQILDPNTTLVFTVA